MSAASSIRVGTIGVGEIAMSKMPAGACLCGAILIVGLVGLAPVQAWGDDAGQVQQVLAARCLKQGKLGQTPEELKANCGCLATVGAKHLQPAWRKAILAGTSEQGLGPPMDDQAQFEIDAVRTCPAIAPYQPKPAGQ
jgi:hypothetical protein